jgi:curli biogenesis system outer membrane secretion channel CsgG
MECTEPQYSPSFEACPLFQPEVVVAALRGTWPGLLSLALLAPAAAWPQDSRATVAVMYFTNSALVNHADYEPLSKGIAEMLITELAASPQLQVVERDRLQKLLEEQNLSGSGRVDQQTAVQLGKILGARHMLMGGFVIDPKRNLRLDLRAVDVETSRVEYVETVSGKAEDVLSLISTLGSRVNSRLKLPPLPTARRTGHKTSKSDQLRAVMLLSRALNEEDRGNTSGAIALYREALGVYPQYERARVLLASAEQSGKSATPQ